MRSLRNMLHRTKIELKLRQWFDRYPKEPLLYLCKDNATTGVVRGNDFDLEVMTERSICGGVEKTNGIIHEEQRVYRPIVAPIFLFSDNKRLDKVGIIGSVSDLHTVLQGCMVEERSFRVQIHTTPKSLRSLKGAMKYLHRV